MNLIERLREHLREQLATEPMFIPYTVVIAVLALDAASGRWLWTRWTGYALLGMLAVDAGYHGWLWWYRRQRRPSQ